MAFWGIPWNRVVPGKSTYFKGGKQFEKSGARRPNEGLITARDFGGTAKWRTCYTSDGTGHTLLYTMDNKVVEMGVKVHDRMEAVSLIHNGEVCMGVPLPGASKRADCKRLPGQGHADRHGRIRQAFTGRAPTR